MRTAVSFSFSFRLTVWSVVCVICCLLSVGRNEQNSPVFPCWCRHTQSCFLGRTLHPLTGGWQMEGGGGKDLRLTSRWETRRRRRSGGLKPPGSYRWTQAFSVQGLEKTEVGFVSWSWDEAQGQLQGSGVRWGRVRALLGPLLCLVHRSWSDLLRTR